MRAFNEPTFLEDLTGLSEMHKAVDDLDDMDFDWDSDEDEDAEDDGGVSASSDDGNSGGAIADASTATEQSA